MNNSLLSILFVLIALTCHSQTDVITNIDSFDMELSLKEYVHTAQYKPTHVKKALHPVIIITAETLEKRGVTRLDEALALLPSVRFNFDPILGTQLKLRGISSSNVAVLIDGIPVIGRLDGAIDISQIPLNNVKQIEIIEGPLSTIYGNNAAGGVINIITNQSQAKKWSLNAGSQIESIGSQNYLLDLGHQNKKWYLSAHGRYFKYDKYSIDSLRVIEKLTASDGTISTRSKYPWNPKIQQGIGGTVKYRLDPENSISLKYDVNEEEISDYGGIKRPQFKPYAQDDFFNTLRQDIAVNYDGMLFNKVYIELTSAYNRFNRQIDNKRFLFEENQYDSLNRISDTTLFNTFFNRLNISSRINESWEVTGGITYTNEAGKGGRIRSEDNTDEAAYSEWAAYGDVRYILKRNLSLSYSARFLTQNVFGNNLTNAVKLKYDLGKNWIFRASYAQGYRSPTLKELYIEFIDVNHNINGNPDLTPEKSNDMQLTVQYNYKRWLEVKLNGYQTYIKDKISLVQYDEQRYDYQNVDKYDVYGAQLAIGGLVKELSWHLAGSLGYWNTEIGNNSAPSHGRILDMAASLNYMIKRIDVGTSINYRYTGAQPLYSLQDEVVIVSRVSATDFLDCSLNRSFWKSRISVVAGCKNIFNTTSTFITGESTGGMHAGSSEQLINQGRSYFVRLGVKF